MSQRPDKLPTVDPMQPDVYMAILRAVDIERKRRSSHDFRQQMEREAQAEGARAKLAAMALKKSDQDKVDEIWAARIRNLPSFGALPKL